MVRRVRGEKWGPTRAGAEKRLSERRERAGGALWDRRGRGTGEGGRGRQKGLEFELIPKRGGRGEEGEQISPGNI